MVFNFNFTIPSLETHLYSSAFGSVLGCFAVKNSRDAINQISMAATLGAVAPTIIAVTHNIANQCLKLLGEGLNYVANKAVDHVSRCFVWAQANPIYAGLIGLTSLIFFIALSFRQKDEGLQPA